MGFRIDAKTAVSLLFLLVVAVVLVMASMPLGGFMDDSVEMQCRAIEQAISAAMLQCYALEGSYPPDVNYLAENYGVIINRELYYYHYEVFASNVRPEISVTPRNRS